MNSKRSALRREVQSHLRHISLDSDERAVVQEIVLDHDGYDAGAAESILAAILNRDLATVGAALRRLQSRGLLQHTAPNGHQRIVANYSALHIPMRLGQRIRAGSPSPFRVIDAPASPSAMGTLHSLFLEEARPLYLGIEVTAHSVFKHLKARADAGFTTVVIMPRKRIVRSAKRDHSDEVLRGWIGFVRSLPRHARRNLHIRIATGDYPYLYSSTLTPEIARFDCYWYDQGTTRRGTMVSANAGSSLYDLVKREYGGLLERSAPLFRLDPRGWLLEGARQLKHVLVVVALVAVCIGLEYRFGEIPGIISLVTFLLGLAGEALWKHLDTMFRPPRDIFDA